MLECVFTNKLKEPNIMKQHFDLLGKPAKDLVTGFSGVVTSLSFDLYGCIQVVITPESDKKEGIKDGHWFDVARIKVTKDSPVMNVPDFEKGYVAKVRKGPPPGYERLSPLFFC